MIQIAVLANHENGRDSHIRQIKVYGPRPDPTGDLFCVFFLLVTLTQTRTRARAHSHTHTRENADLESTGLLMDAGHGSGFSTPEFSMYSSVR